MSSPGGRQDRAAATKAKNARRRADIVEDFRQEAERREQEILSENIASDEHSYLHWVEELKGYITRSYQGVERRIAQRELEKASSSLLERRNLDGPVYDAPIVIKPFETTRPFKGFEFARKLDDIEKTFQERILCACAADARDVRVWTGLALWSAISRSQLNTPEHLDALIHWLCAGEGSQFGCGVEGRATIRLVIRSGTDKVFQGNHWADKDKTVLERVHHFYPDILTLILLKRARSFIEERYVASLDAGLCLKAALGGGGHDELPRVARICANARWLADVRRGLRVSEAFLSVADGSLDNVGLDDVAHDLLFGGSANRARPLPDLAGEIPQARLELADSQSQSAVTPVFRRLQEILRKQGGLYPANAVTTRRLEALRRAIEDGDDNARKGSIEHLLVSWLHFLASKERTPRRSATEGLATATLATYFSRIGPPLYEAIWELNPADLDPETLAEIFEDILGQVVHSSTRAETRDCLRRFHRFASANGDLPPLTGDLGLGADQFVRARVLPLWRFRDVCAELEKNHSATEARVLITAAVIAYRGGLRAGEVSGLAGRDLLDCADPWLLVRPNKFGRIKTRSGRRRIPIGQLMLAEECAALRKYHQDGPRKWPGRAFFHDPWLGHGDNRSWISTEVSKALKAVCGSDWTFHHLRHSAANNLLLALEGYKCDATSKLCTRITGWPAEQQKLICRSVAQNPDNVQSIYVALAGFMGHASPSHTFSSYLHVVEPIMALRRAKASIVEDTPLLSALLGKPLKWIRRRETDGALHDVLEGRRKQSEVQADSSTGDEEPDKSKSKIELAPSDADQQIYPRDIFAFLQEVERSPDTDIATIGRRHRNSGQDALRIVDAARAVAGLQTRGGELRFQKPRERSANSKDPGFLLPSRLRGSEAFLIRDAIERLRVAWDESLEQRKMIYSALTIFLRRYYADTTHLRLSVSELEPFRRFMEQAGMRPEITPVKSRARSAGAGKTGKAGTRMPRKHDIKWATAPGRATRALGIVCHWLIIRLYSAEQINRMANGPKTPTD